MDLCNKYVNKSCVCINIETTAQNASQMLELEITEEKLANVFWNRFF